MTGLETLVPGNIALFQAITAVPDSPAPLILVAKGFADFGPLLALMIATLLFFTGPVRNRHAVVLAGIAMLLGLGVNFAIASITYVPRPFEVGLGLNLLHHAPETSFPSDHATLMWSLGFGLLFLGRFWTSAVVLALGAATAWARVYLGEHFPFDMAGSLGISMLAGLVILLARSGLTKTIIPPVDQVYAFVIGAVSRIGRTRPIR